MILMVTSNQSDSVMVPGARDGLGGQGPPHSHPSGILKQRMTEKEGGGG